MDKKRTGNLGLFSSTAPLIQKGRVKDVDAKAELDSVKRNRDFPKESERAKALRLQREAMPVDVNPKVPDVADGIAWLNQKNDDDDVAISFGSLESRGPSHD